MVENSFSAISTGTERARVQLSQKSLLGKARERPDLVREVWARARRDGVKATVQAVQSQLGQETPVGYSCAGTVVEVGEHIRGLQPGDRVACAGATANHAQLVSVPANLCARIPDGVALESAAITTIAAIALHGIRLAETRVGDRVAVIGCGLVGQLTLRLLRAAGAKTFALDIDSRRVEQASAGGADHALVIGKSTVEQLWSQTGSVGVDQVIVAAAAQGNEPLLLASEIARERGIVVLVGAVPIELPRAPLYEKELRFRVSRSYGPGRYDAEYEERGLDYPIGYVRWTEQRNMEAVLDLMARGLVSFADLVETVPVDHAAEAYSRLTDGADPRRGALVLSYGGDNGRGRAERTAAPQTSGAPVKLAAAALADRNGGTHTTSPKRGIARPRVRIALIGPGGFAGRALIPALQAAEAELVVVAGGAGRSAAATVRDGTFRRTAVDESAAIADPEVDAVVICTRHGNHAALAAQALSAGKHVYCEKPLALSTDERDAAMEAAHSSSGILQVGFNRRFSPLLQEMRSFLAEPGAPMTLIYRVSAGVLPADHWLHDLAQGGGRALGEGCHFVDSLSFLTGQPVVELSAAGHGPRTRPLQAFDNLTVSLRFADGSVASLVYVADGSRRVPKERIEGFCGNRTVLLHDYIELDLYRAGSHRSRRLKTQDKGHRQEIVAFLQAVRSGKAAVKLSEIDNVTLATLAIVESLRSGCPVRLDS